MSPPALDHAIRRCLAKDQEERWHTVRDLGFEGSISLLSGEQRVAERTEELRESESQFRSLANSIPQLAWMTHPDGSIFWWLTILFPNISTATNMTGRLKT